MLKKLWLKFKNWCIVTWKQLDNWQTLLLFILVCLVIYSPVWVGYLLYWIFKWKWCLWMATAVLAFWAGPFTPFFPICMAITLAIKKAFIHLKEKTKQIFTKSKETGKKTATRNGSALNVRIENKVSDGRFVKDAVLKDTAVKKQK